MSTAIYFFTSVFHVSMGSNRVQKFNTFIMLCLLYSIVLSSSHKNNHFFLVLCIIRFKSGIECKVIIILSFHNEIKFFKIHFILLDSVSIT